MNATLHPSDILSPRVSPRAIAREIARLLSVFVAIMLTLRGLLGPEEEPGDDPAAVYYSLHKYAGAGD